MRPKHLDDRAERPAPTLPIEEEPPTIVSLKRPGFVTIKLDDLGMTAEEMEALAGGAKTLFAEEHTDAEDRWGLETDPAAPTGEPD